MVTRSVSEEVTQILAYASGYDELRLVLRNTRSNVSCLQYLHFRFPALSCCPS